MGLDAVVFCDCVERKKLKVPHPFPGLLFVRSNGSPEIHSKNPARIDKHDMWMESPPCQHKGMMAAGSYLGNVVLVERVHQALESVLRYPLPRCPIVMTRVLQSGTHTGDYLKLRHVRSLERELQKLKQLDLRKAGVSSAELRLIRSVIAKLGRLTKVALRIKKPIAF